MLHDDFEAGDTEQNDARRYQTCCKKQPLGCCVANIVRALGGAPAISSMQANMAGALESQECSHGLYTSICSVTSQDSLAW